MDPGEGFGGPAPPPYHPDQTEAQRDEKKNLETTSPPPPYQGLDDRLPPTLLSQGPDPALYIFNFEGQIMANILLVLREQLYRKLPFLKYKKHKFGLCFRTKSKSMWLKNSCNSCSSYKFVKQEV